MQGVTVVSHPLVQHKLTLMRDKTRSTKGFRQLAHEIGMLLCYELTRNLELEMISIEGRTLIELMSDFRSRYFISGEINSEVADQEAKIAEIVERYGEGAEVSRLDGVSVDHPDWHFNVRPSNTEPLLRLNLESLVSQQHMEEKRDEILGLVRA